MTRVGEGIFIVFLIDRCRQKKSICRQNEFVDKLIDIKKIVDLFVDKKIIVDLFVDTKIIVDLFVDTKIIVD